MTVCADSGIGATRADDLDAMTRLDRQFRGLLKWEAGCRVRFEPFSMLEDRPQVRQQLGKQGDNPRLLSRVVLCLRR